jgi:hypothetical protein
MKCAETLFNSQTPIFEAGSHCVTPGWPQIHDSAASVSQVLGLQASTTMPSHP